MSALEQALGQCVQHLTAKVAALEAEVTNLKAELQRVTYDPGGLEPSDRPGWVWKEGLYSNARTFERAARNGDELNVYFDDNGPVRAWTWRLVARGRVHDSERRYTARTAAQLAAERAYADPRYDLVQSHSGLWHPADFPDPLCSLCFPPERFDRDNPASVSALETHMDIEAGSPALNPSVPASDRKDGGQ